MFSPILAHDYEVTINDRRLPQKAADDVIDISVEQRLDMCSRFTLTLRTWDPQRLEYSWVDSALFALGNKVEIKLGIPGRLASVIYGEITDLDLAITVGEPARLTVTGLDARHSMARGRKTRTFKEPTYEGIASKIADEHGLKLQVGTSPSAAPEQVVQNNESDLAFLESLATDIGYELSIVGKQLRFRRPNPLRQAAATLSPDKGLVSFSPRISVMSVVGSAEVRGMDPQEAKAIVGKAQVANLGKAVVGVLEGTDTLNGSGTQIITHRPVATQGEADALAQVELQRILANCLSGSGECFGDPAVQAGELVRIDGVSRRFSGTYYVSSVTHHFATGSYRTSFSLQGGPNASAGSTAEALEPSGQRGERIPGAAVAKVTNTKDPKHLGRVKLRFPWLAETYESDWARVVAPTAGKDRGLYFPPEVDDEVLVMFDHGDVGSPYVLGGTWSKNAAPPDENKDGKNNLRLIKSRSGHTITLDDTDGAEKISIRDKTGNNELTIDSKNGAMILKVEKDLKLQAGGAILLDAAKDLTLKAGGKLSLEGQEVSLDAKQAASLQATQGMKLNCTAGVTVNDGALEVK